MVAVKGLIVADVMFPNCLDKKYVYMLSLGVWFVIILGFHLYVEWYLLYVLWRGHYVFWVNSVF